mgnify:FL=1
MQEAPASSRPTSQKENSRANKLSNQHRSYVILQVLSDINLDSHKKIEQIQVIYASNTGLDTHSL